VTASVRGTYQDQSPLANITVMGLATAPRSMELNGEVLDASHWTYTAEKSLLVVSGLETKFRQGAFQKSWSLLWSH
jgi:alpha-glucosidase